MTVWCNSKNYMWILFVILGVYKLEASEEFGPKKLDIKNWWHLHGFIAYLLLKNWWYKHVNFINFWCVIFSIRLFRYPQVVCYLQILKMQLTISSRCFGFMTAAGENLVALLIKWSISFSVWEKTCWGLT